MTKAIVVKAETERTKKLAQQKQPHQPFNGVKGLAKLKTLGAYIRTHGVAK